MVGLSVLYWQQLEYWESFCSGKLMLYKLVSVAGDR
jgi:hypothetical protein